METRSTSLKRVISSTSSASSAENFFPDFGRFLQRQYPLLQKYGVLPSELLCSPHILLLPSSILPKIHSVVRAFHSLRDSPLYRERLKTNEPELLSFDPGNESILMGYDFHLDEAGEPKLIEINTNASFSLIAQAMRDFQRLPPFADEHMRNKLQRSFENELLLALGSRRPEGVAIMDENPEQQKLFVEFLMFQNLFESFGWPTSILRPSDIKYSSGRLTGPAGLKIDLVYNRDTDFTLQGKDREPVRAAYLQKKVCVSPNPHEYLLLADKSRLAEVSSDRVADLLPSELATALDQYVPKCLDLNNVARPEEIWARRKSLFFKPKRMFGSKGAYRGSSISKKAFEQALSDGFIIQEYVPAPEIEITGDSSRKFKFDLRFYVYQSEIQLAVARLYQGQVTNSQTLGGGFASVIFS